jgi:hypothetical protein
MANKKKTQKKFAEEPLLTEENVWSVVEFARSMSAMYGQTYVNPMLVNERLKDINLNPMAATQTLLETAMESPKNNESNLQKFSQDFELTSMIYKKLISYLANMLAFDITYTSNAEPDDYKSPKYKKDLKSVETFLDKFEYKSELRIATKEMLRNDAYFACFRNVGDKYILQELPSEYCKITGRWGGGFLFSFNMYWFLLPGVDINMYPDFFKKKYREIWVDSNTVRDYNPSLPPELRGKSSWIYWVDVPVDIGVCFKLTPELATRLPYFTPLFNDLVLQSLMRNLQKNISMAAASKIIIGEVPLLNKEAKATVKDSMAISPDLLGKFMALVKSAISEAIKIASAPLVNMKPFSFESDNEMYNSYARTVYALSGVNTNLIFTSDVKPNSVETQLSLNVDEQMMTGLYEQFNLFMDYHIGKITKTFKFNFIFEGTDFFLNRDARLEKAMSLFDKGIILPQKIAAAMGMKPAQLRKHMEESASMGFMSMLTPPALEGQKEIADMNITAQQEAADKVAKAQKETAKLNQKETTTEKVTSGGGIKTAIKSVSTPTSKAVADNKGRPKKKISELGDEGLATRDGAQNVGRGGKVKSTTK